MTTQEFVKIKFQPKLERDFADEVRVRVDAYFQQNNISRHANWLMYLKSVILCSSLIALYIAILSEDFSKPVLLLMAMAMGIVHGMIGVNISHDALHGSYTSSSRWNKILGYTYDFVGLSSLIWKQTHNFRHHIYTNIPGVDHDIEKGSVLRFSPKNDLFWFHKYQYLYAFPLYCLTGLNWVLYSDYIYFFGERKKKPISMKDQALFFFFKGLNLFLFLLFPLWYMTLPWWQILIGYLALQFAGGFVVAVIFQLAHLVQGIAYPEPDAEGLMEDRWAEHEMKTTANFATQNPFVNFVCGGLNFQIEHHLFPYVCHVHYANIAPIVKQTAQEFKLPYYENPSVTKAIISHLRHLKDLGKISS